MRFDVRSLAADLGGGLVGSSGEAEETPEVNGLSIDSRSLERGQLFAAVSDTRDGHDFVTDARAAGAPAVLVNHVVDDGRSIVVPDVERALVRLAGLARRRLPEFVVGVTGSVGKTTTKDMLASVLARQYVTAASVRSFNNELGVPLTLANAGADTQAVVVEMGARGHGHIALLCSMALPTVGVVTAVQAVHTEHMGGEEQIAVAKRELVEHLPPSGLAVLHAADQRVAAMAAHTRAEVLTFGGSYASRDAGDVRAESIRIDDDLLATFVLVSPWGSAEVSMGARGVHNVDNALAAAAVGLWAGLDPESVASGLAEPIESPWRMELIRTGDGLTILNDSYNAGPASMAAALESLGALAARDKVAVLGLMAELGERELQEHQRIAELAAELGVTVVAVGTDLYGSVVVPDAGSVVEALRSAGHLREGTAILVKGSRVAGLEAVADALVPRPGDAGSSRDAQPPR